MNGTGAIRREKSHSVKKADSFERKCSDRLTSMRLSPPFDKQIWKTMVRSASFLGQVFPSDVLCIVDFAKLPTIAAAD
jgi:hypothetical protein